MKTPATEQSRLRQRAMEHQREIEMKRAMARSGQKFLNESQRQLEVLDAYSKAVSAARYQSMVVDRTAVADKEHSGKAAASSSKFRFDLDGRQFFVEEESLSANDLAYFASASAERDLLQLRCQFWDATADFDKIDQITRRLVYPVFCDECGELIFLARKSIMGQAVPQLRYQIVLRDPKTGSTYLEVIVQRSTGKRSHWLVDPSNDAECYCGYWFRGKLYLRWRADCKDLEKAHEAQWWGCAFLKAAVHAKVYPNSACRCVDYKPPGIHRASNRWTTSQIASAIFSQDGADAIDDDDLICQAAGASADQSR
ncbi:unnamed protein product [Amoebophrya sp. A25]|nr:unnamed protein product [Amoebophrya sp. A25]|eukprot:GSA25T00011217001.1